MRHSTDSAPKKGGCRYQKGQWRRAYGGKRGRPSAAKFESRLHFQKSPAGGYAHINRARTRYGEGFALGSDSFVKSGNSPIGRQKGGLDHTGF